MPADAAPKVPADADAAAVLSTRRLWVSTALGVLGLVVAFAVVGYTWRQQFMALGAGFVDRFGGFGVALGFSIPDAFTIPLPNDVFLALGIAGGMGDAVLIAWATAGSVVGGSVGWLLGRLLRRTAWFRRFMAKRGAGLDQALRTHGVKMVAIAAVTPLPYSVSAWAAGSTFMPYPTFFVVSLLRVVRVTISLYLIHLGLLATS